MNTVFLPHPDDMLDIITAARNGDFGLALVGILAVQIGGIECLERENENEGFTASPQ